MSYFTNELGPKRLGLLLELMAGSADFLCSPIRRAPQPRPPCRRLGGGHRGRPGAFGALGEQQPRARPSICDDLAKACPRAPNERGRVVLQSARWPRATASREYTDVGGLMSYGANISDIWDEVGSYVGRILKRDKPAICQWCSQPGLSSSSICRPPKRWPRSAADTPRPRRRGDRTGGGDVRVWHSCAPPNWWKRRSRRRSAITRSRRSIGGGFAPTTRSSASCARSGGAHAWWARSLTVNPRCPQAAPHRRHSVVYEEISQYRAAQGPADERCHHRVRLPRGALAADSHQQPATSASCARSAGAPASWARFLTVNRRSTSPPPGCARWLLIRSSSIVMTLFSGLGVSSDMAAPSCWPGCV